MLRQRLLTALILIPLVVWGVIALPAWGLAAGLAAVLAIGAWEWARLAGLREHAAQFAYVALTLACIAATGYVLMRSPQLLRVLLAAAILWWVFMLPWLISYQGGRRMWTGGRLAGMISGLVILVATWAAVVGVRLSSEQGAYYVLFLLILVWVADSAAYFTGRRWGSHKLAPRLSPGKTWEGVWGALVGTALAGLLGALVFGVALSQVALFIVLSVATAAFSVLGDLMVSLFKRQVGVKDSGHLLPGHGGVMDRLDSLTAAAPVFVLGLLVLGMAS